MNAPRLVLALVSVSLLSGTPYARADESGSAGTFQLLRGKLEGKTRRYSVWLPPGYRKSERWPAIVFLHGSGESGEDGEKPTKIGLGPALRAHPERWPFVVIFPQKPTETEEWWEHERLVLDLLERARKQFSIDRDRVALCGISQGGHGAWFIGARHPHEWSCIVAVCGYGRSRTIAPRIARLPVWAFHGLRDDLVNPEDTRRVVEAIRAERTRLGLDPEAARMTLYPEANHNSWDPAFAEADLPGWISSARRSP